MLWHVKGAVLRQISPFSSVSLNRGVRLYPDNELPANEKEKQRKA